MDRKTVTDEELRRLDELDKVATKGPWVAEESDGYITGYVYSKYHKYHHPKVRKGLVTDPTTMTNADAHFIAEARTSVPRLVAEVRRLRKLLKVK
jgi:hypothetical protein